MKKLWIGIMTLVAALITYLYISRAPAPSQGKEITQAEPAPAPPRPTKVARPQPQWELPPGITPPPRDYSYLPESKHSAVIKAEEKIAEEFRHHATPGKQDATGIEELKKSQSELDQLLNAILTTEEKFEYDLRNSIVAQSLRTTLHPMEPTDGEFRAIYKLRSLFELRITTNPSDLDEAWQECDTSIRATIGSNRFERYLLTNNKDFQTIYHFFLKERVEPEIVDKLYMTWANAGARADAIRMDESITIELKQQQLKKLAETCLSDMEQILGNGPGSGKLEAQRRNLTAIMESHKPRTPRRAPEILGLQPGMVLMQTAP